MKTIRSILYHRLKFWLIIGWVIASLMILLTTGRQVVESVHTQVNHTAQMMLAFAASQNLSTTKLKNPDQSTNQSHSLESLFVVIIQNDSVRYQSIDVPASTLLALPLKGKVELQDRHWKIFSATTPQNNTRVVIGVWTLRILGSALLPTTVVALILLLFAGVFLFITARATRGVVEPLEQLTTAVEARGEDNLSPIQTVVEIEELAKIETALNRLIRGLDEAMQRERQFIFNAAHELRTPLTAIRAQVEAIDTSANDALAPEQLQGVVKATDRATRLVGQMLDLARSETIDPQSCSDQTINIVELTQDVIAELIPDALRHGGEIELICDQSIMLPGNYDLLYPMIRNLIENAVKYGTAPAKVIVSVSQGKDSRITLSVEDNGPGLDDSQFEMAFGKFERLGLKSGDGVGLGLSIVKQILKRSGISLSKQGATELGGLKLVAHFPDDSQSSKTQSVFNTKGGV